MLENGATKGFAFAENALVDEVFDELKAADVI